ncbi:MAG TPA: hypothetical protein VFS00_31780 [Polyangiaceae bacterium]|nr:hypothetical protein [Polyangiaceae bacterium]
MSSLPLLVTCAQGLGLGLLHALDSDHVAAVTTIVASGKGPRRAMAIGAWWGAGHAAAVVGAGALLVALGAHMPARLALLFDGLVVCMLASLGVGVLWRAQRARSSLALPGSPGALAASGASGTLAASGASGTLAASSSSGALAASGSPASAPSHALPHGHGHGHAHAHPPARTPLRALIVGLVHGASGTAAVALAVLTTLPGLAQRYAYLFLFAGGAALGMTLLSALLALSIGAAARRFALPLRALYAAAGCLSLGAAAALLRELVAGLST